MAIVPVQLARVSNLLRTTTSTGQITRTQQNLLRVQNELSTGKRLNAPSDDPGDAAIVQQLQKTLEQREAYLGNLLHAQSQLSEADSAMGDLTSLLQEAQQIASANVGSDVTPDQRTASAAIIENLYNQALTLGNRQFEGTFIFGGDRATQEPYVSSGGGVRYQGTGNVLENSVDENTSQAFMVSGQDVFGGFSGQVKGTRDLGPSVGGATRLGDLAGVNGSGIAKGSIQVSNGTDTAVVDLSGADSLANVIAAINSAGVGGITASLSPSGTGLQLTGGATDDITVTDVAGGTAARDLGILLPVGGGAGVALVGGDVNARVTEFTSLASLNGGAGVSAAGLVITNGLKTANIAVPPGGTVGDLLNAINGSDTGVVARVNAAGNGIDILNPIQGIEMSVGENGGTTAADLGIRSMSTTTQLADLNNGQGVRSNETGPDLTITRTDGTSFDVDVTGLTSVQDVIDAINTASGGVGVTASFATVGNGIVLTDTAGGGGTLRVNPVNGSDAAADLGLTNNAVGNVITGSDVNAPVVEGVFSSFAKLRDALRASDQAGITEAASLIEQDMARVVRVRGETGAHVQEIESRQDRLQDQNVATKSLLSSLEDTDFPEAIARFQTLQTALQATLQTAGQTLNLSLLDFLG